MSADILPFPGPRAEQGDKAGSKPAQLGSSPRRPATVTVGIPYYNQPTMLIHQLATYLSYSPLLRELISLIVVDDGSMKAPALASIPADMLKQLKQERFSLYRIGVDIPWNRGEARNIIWREAKTNWLIQLDIDHTLPREAAEALVMQRWTEAWYRFPRFRVGKADHTRNKDDLPRDAEFGPIKPHIDSYLCDRNAYAKAGGYNLEFSGCLGGGSPFLKEMERANNAPGLLTGAFLQCFTTDAIDDASADLPRGGDEYKKRKAELSRLKKIKGRCEVRNAYEKQL